MYFNFILSFPLIYSCWTIIKYDSRSNAEGLKAGKENQLIFFLCFPMPKRNTVNIFLLYEKFQMLKEEWERERDMWA